MRATAALGPDMTGPEFKAALRELGLTQAEFGRRTGHVEQTVSDWGTGRRPLPEWVPYHIETARKLRQSEDMLRKIINAPT